METISRMTLEEISKKVGISRTTIYKVLKNKEGVSEETRNAVQDALETYHYVQNRNARNLAMNRHYTIGYVGFRSKSASYFSKEVRNGLTRAQREFGDDGLSIRISEFDVEKPQEQIAAVNEMREEGIDSFILAYSSHEVIMEIMERLEEDGCEVVLLSRDIPEHPDNFYVGVDYERSGRLAAELLAKFLPHGGKVFVPVTEEYASNQDIQSRLRGFEEKIHTYDGIDILPVQFGLTEETAIRGALQKALEEEQPDAIFDLTYRLDVVASVLEQQHRDEQIRLVGFDLFDEIRPFIADATIDAVIYQDLHNQAYQAVRILFNELCYDKIREEKKTFSKLEIVMSENLGDF